MEEVDRRNYTISLLAKDVRAELVSCWQRANAEFRPPVIMTNKSIERKIQVAWSALENYAWNRGGMKKEGDRKEFVDKLDFLFSISSCRHNILPCSDVGCSGCEEEAHLDQCTCKKGQKIPKLELSFMMSMKRLRPPGHKATMMMSGLDAKETSRQRGAAARKEKDVKAKERAAEKMKETEKEMEDRIKDAEEELLLQDIEANTEEEATTEEAIPKKKNMIKIPHTALAAIRTEASNRQAAAIASGYIKDLIDAEILPPESEYLAVDPKKIHRAREEVMEKVQDDEENYTLQDNIKTVMMDSRITKTKVCDYNPVTGKHYKTTQKKDIYTMTDGNGRFLHHFIKEKVPEDSNMSSSQALALQVYEWCLEYGVTDTLEFIAGDSTNSNTGYKGGAFHFLEEYLEKRLFWIVCQLHTNELKLRRLITKRDGKTSSKDGWEGELGKLLPTVRSLKRTCTAPVIPGKTELPDLPPEVVKDIGSDQEYGHRITNAVRKGKMDEDLAALTVGQTGHSRWLTTANLFCDWWFRDHGLEGELLARLREIVDFIINVYFPCWFQIKINHSWVDGPTNVLFELSCLRTQSEVVQETVMPTVRSSAWFAHSEPILMTMLCSKEEEERRFAANQILVIRGGQEMGDSSLRLRKLPYLNTEATKLKDLISWEEATEPINTCKLSKSEVLEFIEKPLEVEYRPCHTQAIERAVKEVTAAAGAVCGADRRDGFIRGRALHIELMPKINSKKDLMNMQKLTLK